jgi:hypothetical protein
MTTDKGAPQAASFACEVAREFLYLEEDGGFDDDAALRPAARPAIRTVQNRVAPRPFRRRRFE